MTSYEVIQESSCEVDLYNVIHIADTIYTARWYRDRFPDMDEEIYIMLEAISRNYDNVDHIVEHCQNLYDDRVHDKLENFGSNHPNPEADGLECCFDIEEINYDVIKDYEAFDKAYTCQTHE